MTAAGSYGGGGSHGLRLWFVLWCVLRRIMYYSYLVFFVRLTRNPVKNLHLLEHVVNCWQIASAANNTKDVHVGVGVDL